MADASFEVAYDGDALSEHVMDVQHLAPALLAIGNYVREANAQLNGDRSKVRVLVQSDFEHRCFNVGLDVAQTVLEHVRSLLRDDDVVTAKDLIEWLGLVSSPLIGVLAYLKWKRGRPVKNVTQISDTTESGTVQVEVGDGNTLTITQHVYNLAENPRVAKAASGIVAPTQEEGIEKVTFRRSSKEETGVVSYSREDARDILASCAAVEAPDEKSYEPESLTAHLRVYSPVFDPAAERWRFKYGDDIIYADITETDIAADAIARGGAMIDDLYTVKLEVTEHETPQHHFRKSYKIKEVLNFTPAPRQSTLFDRSPKSDR